MSKVVGAEEESVTKYIIDGVRLGSSKETKVTYDDPFEKSIKDIEGVNPNIQRRASRQLKKTFTGQNGAKSKQIEIEAMGYNYLDVVQPQYNLDWLAKLTAINAEHYAAIRAKEANIVGLGFKFVESPKMKRKLNNTDESDKIDNLRKRLAKMSDEMLDYLESLNDDDSFIDTLGKAWFDYESTGVGYIEIGRNETPEVDTDYHKISYIGHIPSTTMRVRRQRDGYVQIVSNKAVFFRNFGSKTPDQIGGDTNPNEIIMLKKYSATDSFYGLPDIIPAAQAVAGNEYSARFNLDYFENKAVPRHVIILKGAELSSAAERSISEFFETGLKGKNHRSLYIPLPADRPDSKVELKIEAVESGVQDQSFEKYRKSNRSEILLAHRVPPNKIGLSEGMSVATALDASKTFKEQVCLPQQQMLAKKINKIIKEWSPDLVIEFIELTLTDEDTQSKIDERYIRNQVDVPNEVRTRRGLPGIKGGDKVVDLKAQAKAETRAATGKTRAEDSNRSAATSTTSAEGRAPKGEGSRS